MREDQFETGGGGNNGGGNEWEMRDELYHDRGRERRTSSKKGELIVSSVFLNESTFNAADSRSRPKEDARRTEGGVRQREKMKIEGERQRRGKGKSRERKRGKIDGKYPFHTSLTK
ncbi:hypothetical protein Nepgr_029960 [Nepenthes gracilis]|uniref:Uncharacterized protein n=1 Tax=Nepenthes gracilis TaxID=150966 RepID=A0AAD3TEX2_NEPGR|nr:hypothetical protein Nepgr_029960 [Nepenthes gracilis]